ncbi:hypothetical protein K435DRAFT_142131 [Dendrothele bispora CBS 962.96]|uniref:Arrestin-like N-terminal domain-containing protein n=1 Tax=Dendrothele bispora (strain CBS 962.96) TaxID=1314807 RepID=A0A4S8LZ72_DENBC|nr:hypothetical protein K435DRAFT_142131 [Dendrothele bispora CBS 962.96]
MSLPASISRLPSYTPSSPPPSYFPDPTNGEQRIYASGRIRSRPTGIYTKKSSGITVALTEQDSSKPFYDRQGIVNGFILAEDRKAISEVQIELIGEMDLSVPEYGAGNVTLFQNVHTLWKLSSESDQPSSRSNICPNTIPFACIFPLTFVSNAKDPTSARNSLPPSLDISFLGTLSASVKYLLKVRVIYERYPPFHLWNRVKTTSLSLNYYPRSRPPYPLNLGPDLFTDLKIAPEEWHQTISVVKSNREDVVSSVDCHLFVPSLRIYGLADTIPVHIGLTGCPRSLRHFLYSPDSDELRAKNLSNPGSLMSVQIIRQVCVKVDGIKAVRSTVIGEGKVREVPPHIDEFVQLEYDEERVTLHWEGEVRCFETTTLGGFSTSHLSLKDFIILRVNPVSTDSGFSSHQVEVSIKLVTDSAGIDF